MTSYFNIICPEDRQLQPKPHDLDSSYAAAVGLWRPAFRKAVSIVSHAPLQCRRAQTTAMLWACTILCSQLVKRNCTMSRHSLFLRWGKKKRQHCNGEEIQLFRTLALGLDLFMPQKIEVSASVSWVILKNHFLQTRLFWPTRHAFYSQIAQQTPKYFVSSLKKWEAPAVWINRSDWVRYKEKGQNCTCLLKLSKSMEWSHFLDFHIHINSWNKYRLHLSRSKCRIAGKWEILLSWSCDYQLFN